MYQFERLLRAIYRPQNAYCVHVDANAPPVVFSAVEHIAHCLNETFGNVLVPTTRVHVRWGEYSVLEAELICFRELLAIHGRRKWRYAINLTGQEFPLRTMLELTRILKILNGANLIDGSLRTFLRVFQWRVSFITEQTIPFDILIHHGSVHIVASYRFVQFALEDPKALRLLKFLKENAVITDEIYFATLNHNPDILGAPGSYLGYAETHPETYPSLPRLKNWGAYPCHSKHWVRWLCIWGVDDLPFIATRPELFVNKFYWDFQPLALDCMEEFFWNRTIDDFLAGTNTTLSQAGQGSQTGQGEGAQGDQGPQDGKEEQGTKEGQWAQGASVRQKGPSKRLNQVSAPLDLNYYAQLNVVLNHLP